MTKISVVTICYNAVATLEQTMLSILNQTYSNIEYIIIDGGSTDGTVDIIKKYADKLAYWVSEPDKGIYDAMNKAIERCTGEWINFMNSGDSFYGNNIISSVADFIKGNNDADIIYGDVNIIYDWGEKVYKPLPLYELKSRMVFSHQSCFVKTELIKTVKFSLKYKIAGDYNFFYHQYMNNRKFEYIPICIANFDGVNGISASRHFTALKENAVINGNINKIKWKLSYFAHMVFININNVVKKILPTKITAIIKHYKNK